MKTSNYIYLLASIFVVSCNLPDDTKDTPLPDLQTSKNTDIRQLEKQVRDTYFQEEPTGNIHYTRANTRPRNVTTGIGAWMETLPDTALLSAINLPGTHRSWVLEDVIKETQEFTVEEQLDMGVRALDIDCYNYRDVFTLFNMPYRINQLFSEKVRDVCIRFLQKHPKEFIVMIIRPLGPDVNCTRSFGETLKAYTKGVEKYFYLTENMPQVKDIRGKIVVLRRFNNITEEPLGNKIEYKDNSTYTSTTTITTRIQDRYYLPTVFHRWGKWENIRSMLNEADAPGSEPATLFLNFTNGISAGCYPYTAAAYINPLIQKHLAERDRTHHHHYGAIMMDYVGYYTPEVIKTIAESNTQ